MPGVCKAHIRRIYAGAKFFNYVEMAAAVKKESIERLRRKKDKSKSLSFRADQRQTVFPHFSPVA